ncbi:uncharacterized protein MELLADRAFT_101816 [Melampsora larici-populina 98AG31]|uniref:Uncharacterized protein n=1 Tax=Melampsora larici-populina (strain 98AG31 / pathotype 3-4-7) TaxID=747676 RepID=F4R505_MELLP|nr:uncharacterized protein MELLADRAFT_101816 [Melampsora larici-populina 98AG31]EGG11973.1 hypothetical protein MELLADRAFT_101816 [Melampsora larici-populina 98AG31]
MKNEKLLLSVVIHVLLGVNLSYAFSIRKFLHKAAKAITQAPSNIVKKIEHSDNAVIEAHVRLVESLTPEGFILRAIGIFPSDVIPIPPPAMKAIKLVNGLKDLHKEDFDALQQCKTQAISDIAVIRKAETSVTRNQFPKMLKQADEIVMYACGGASGAKDDRKRLPGSVLNIFHLLGKIGNAH